jgi:DNA-binding winged helix-turn-helix (wHTH) protein/TolB-like protein/Tfp pilus assembly protein PilF
VLEFGPFRLDLEGRRLLREGTLVPLTPKAFETLAVLVEARDRVAPKTELMERLWPDAVVEEANLTQQIFTLRKTLGNGQEGDGYIRTVPRQGYRFVADVKLLDAEGSELSAGTAVGSAPPPERAGRGRWGWIAVVIVVMVALGAGALVRRSRPVRPAAATLAVLPLVNDSGLPDSDYLADGLTEGLIGELGSVPALRVLGPRTAFRYRDGKVDPREVGRTLQADAVLSGRVVSQGRAVEVQTALLSVADGRRLWAQSYAVEVGGLPKVQRAIRDEVARHLDRADRAPTDAKARVIDEEAYRLCLRGWYFWNRRTEEGLRKGIDLFRQALRRDPKYAEAWSGMAAAYDILPEYSETSEAEAFPAAKHAALEALKLDPNLAEAHAALAFALFWWDRDAVGAEAGFKRALELNPGHATAHHWYGNVLLSLGRTEEAAAQLEEAYRADPLSLIIGAERASVLYHARRFDEAADLLRRTLELDPTFREAHYWLVRTLLARGDHDGAIEACRAGQRVYPQPWAMLAEMGVALARKGRIQEAHEQRRKLEALAGQHPVAYELAVLHAGLGETGNALTDLEHAAVERASDLSFLSTDPAFDTLRQEPRFRALEARLRQPRDPS